MVRCWPADRDSGGDVLDELSGDAVLDYRRRGPPGEESREFTIRTLRAVHVKLSTIGVRNTRL